METVRVGIIGLGNMGRQHAEYLGMGEIRGARLTSVCDVVPSGLRWATERFGDRVETFDSPEAFFGSGLIDAVLIATPHFDHPKLAIEAFRHGLHVLLEKPAGVDARSVRRMNEAAASSGRVFAMMYHMRLNPLFRKLRDLIRTGELGDIRRMNWIATDMYRTQNYYDTGAWRATWGGEGGGVLLNQCAHNIDLWQWTTGLLPKRVRAFCSFGKRRDIEAEDEATVYAEYENGATAVFVACSTEAPGTNRFEVVGDRGKIVIEDGRLTFWRLRMPESKFNRTFKGAFGRPECWLCDVPLPPENAHYRNVTQNWIDAILRGTPLIAPGEEGLRSVEMINAMYLSAWTDEWVELPVDEDRFLSELEKRIATSRFRRGDSVGRDLVHLPAEE